MTHTESLPQAVEPLKRILPPLFLFSLVFLGLLALSWALVLPRYTSLDLNGQLIQASDVPAYAMDLEHQITELEAQRDALTVPLRDPLYIAARAHGRMYVMLEDVENLLSSVLSDTSYSENVVFQTIDIDRNMVTIVGDVRGVGPSSITVLAEFVDALSASDEVTNVIAPPFTRVDDPVIGIHSPFTMSFSVATY